MSYCLNPACQKPQNPAGTKFCVTCGTKLLLKARYRAIAPIGEGGFGKTFLAEDTDRLNARCVIKQFVAMSPTANNYPAISKATQLFEQEAHRLLELGEQHPQIPTLFAYFEQDKRLYLVQQYIEGQDLWHELEQHGAWSEPQIRELLNDLLPVLQFIHEHQVIHRDIKPTNIIRRSTPAYTSFPRRVQGEFVLIDFGIAKQLSGTGFATTGTKTGTEGFAPIEQLRSGKAFPASDLYSMGVTCIQLLTAAQLEDLYDPLEGRWLWRDYIRQRGTDVSDRLAQVLNKLLEDYVLERYQSASEVLAALSQVETVQAAISVRAQFPTPITSTIVQNPPPISKTQSWKCAHTLTGHSHLVRSVAISPDGLTLASGSWDNTIKLWHLRSGKLICTITGHSAPVFAVVFSPDGGILVSGSSDGTIKLWQPSNGNLRGTLSGHLDLVKSVAISSDGQTIASGSDDNTIKLWQTSSGKLIRTITAHAEPVSAVAYSSDSKIIVSGSSDCTIKLWEAYTGKLISTFPGHSNLIKSVAISSNGQIIASGSRDNTIKLWQTSSGDIIGTLTGHSKGVWCVAISLDGEMLASGSSDDTIKLWQLDSGTLLHTLAGHASGVRTVAFSPDGQTLASGGGDNTIKIWRCDYFNP